MKNGVYRGLIETKRLTFRRWAEEDAAELYALASHPEVGPHAGWPVHTSVEESREVIKEYFSNDYTWALISKQTGEIIGCMGYYPYACFRHFLRIISQRFDFSVFTLSSFGNLGNAD